MLPSDRDELYQASNEILNAIDLMLEKRKMQIKQMDFKTDPVLEYLRNIRYHIVKTSQ